MNVKLKKLDCKLEVDCGIIYNSDESFDKNTEIIVQNKEFSVYELEGEGAAGKSLILVTEKLVRDIKEYLNNFYRYLLVFNENYTFNHYDFPVYTGKAMIAKERITNNKCDLKCNVQQRGEYRVYSYKVMKEGVLSEMVIYDFLNFHEMIVVI